MSGRPGEDPLDGWSVVHVLAGVGVGLLVRDALLALLLLVAYEGFEAALRRVKPRGKQGKGLFEHESWTNIGYDVLFGFVGWVFAQGMRPLPFAFGVPFPW